MTPVRYRCTNVDCTEYEQFLDPSDVVWVEPFGARYHAYDRQGMLLDAKFAGSPLPCGPVRQITGPCRIRLRRKKGWRKPVGAVTVTRPGKFGNPLTMDGDRDAAAEWFGVMLDLRREGGLPPGHCGHLYPDDDEIRAALAGCDLACWCPLDHPCHADVLLEVANGA